MTLLVFRLSMAQASVIILTSRETVWDNMNSANVFLFNISLGAACLYALARQFQIYCKS